MAAQKGVEFLLKIGDGATTEAFTTIGGCRSNSFSINNEQVDVTNKDSSGDRELLDGAGITSIEVSGSGIFDGGTEQTLLELKARTDLQANYQIIVPNHGTYEGAFQAGSMELGGEHNGEVTFSVSLSSSGAITFT